MKRREFFKKASQAVLGITMGNTLFQASALSAATNVDSPLNGMLIIDPHAHPEQSFPKYLSTFHK